VGSVAAAVLLKRFGRGRSVGVSRRSRALRSAS
jgi:hypothetical protein